jgi:hypothetical protein
MKTPLPRRAFIKRLGLSLPLICSPLAPAFPASDSGAAQAQPRKFRGQELAADLVIIGGGLGGCAAALAAARNGLRVVLTEETDWIGGQLTAQAVPPDENPWIETFGGTRSYLELRRRIREYYARNLPLTPKARATEFLNPGNGWVSKLCHEPRVALAVLHEMLAPYLAGRRIVVLLRHKAVKAWTNHDRVEAVQARCLDSGHDVVLQAPWFADATEMGDLLPLTGTEFVIGAESRKETGEPHAPSEAAPANLQAFTCCFAMDFLPGEDHTIDKPREYGFWRDFVPPVKPPWPGRLFSWTYSDPQTNQRKLVETDPETGAGLWSYRRIADRTLFAPGTYPGDLSLVNWPQNDYVLGNLCAVRSSEAARHLAHARQLSLSLLYWLQTEAPRPDGGAGWKGLRLRPDVVGTEDGLAKHPYIREGRRIRAEFTVLEQHVSADCRAKETGQPRPQAAPFDDSVGIGSYRIDLHPSTGGTNYIDVASLPFQIPLGALLPQRLENLLPACKNIGVTHITNGCYRLHPVEWNIGEAAGLLAAFCVSQKKAPRQVRRDPELLRRFQQRLTDDGVPLSWPDLATRK